MRMIYFFPNLRDTATIVLLDENNDILNAFEDWRVHFHLLSG